MDVLASGPERSPGTNGPGRLLEDARRRLRRPTTAARRWPRAIAAVLALAVVAGALHVLRAGTDPITTGRRPAALAGDGSPVIIYGRSRLQPPPFDRLPGRTPIPLPSPVRGARDAAAVGGPLPATGTPPGEEAARAAARLVVGRYCRFPEAYRVQPTSGAPWRDLTVLVLGQVYNGPRLVATLRLRWTGDAYAWQGSETEFATCS